MKSDIVEEMYRTQDVNGGWGRFQSKDYSVKAKIPTSSVGIVRCLYIGLTVEDRGILFMAEEYLKGLLLGTSREKNWEKNERATPWRRAGVCNLLEAIRPNSPICDETWRLWLFIAGRAYEDGEYSYERDKGSELYLKNAVDWILENAGEDGLWDWGPQVKDPWGYYGYFSCNKKYKHNRVVDCAIEILNFLKRYIDNNTSQ